MSENEKKMIEPASATEEAKAEAARQRTRDNIARIVVVFLAIAFWMFVKFTQADTFEQSISGVRVEVRGVEKIAFSAIGGYDTTVDIVVRGEQAAVERLHATDIKAYVDVSDVSVAGEHSLKVQFDGLPEHITIAEQSATTLILYMDRDATKEVPLTLSLASYTVEQDYSVGVPASQTDKLKVSGPQTVLDQVESVQIAITAGHMQSSVTAMVDTRNVEVRYFDAKGAEVKNPYLSVEEIRFSVQVPLYGEKNVRLSIANESEFADVSIRPATLRVFGQVERLTKTETISLGSFDIAKGVTQQLELSLPEYLTLVGEQVTEVSVTVTTAP